MNDSTLQAWYNVIGLISTLALLLPLVIITWKKLYVHKGVLAFSAFGLITLFYHLFVLEFIVPSPGFFKIYELAYNLTFTPLLLIFLFYFIDNSHLGATLRKIILSFLAFEVAALVIMGIDSKSIGIILGLGLILVLTFTLITFFAQIKKAVRERIETGKGFVISGLLFACCCYLLLFLLTYVIRTSYTDDVYALYNLASIISNLTISVGLLLVKKRVHVAETKESRNDSLKRIPFPDWDELPLNN